MKKITVYLDTNIISRVPDLRISEEDACALSNLAETGLVRFVTSQKTKQEILRTSNRKKNSLLQFLHALMMQVETVPVYYSGAIGDAPVGATPVAGDWIDPVYSQFRDIFDIDDAEHIVHALKANCDYFMTLDDKTILKPAKCDNEKIKAICGNMALLSPVDVLKAIDLRAEDGNIQ